MSFLCTTINKEVSYHRCIDECQYIFKSACIDRMNEAYNQALDDFAEKMNRMLSATDLRNNGYYIENLVSAAKNELKYRRRL